MGGGGGGGHLLARLLAVGGGGACTAITQLSTQGWGMGGNIPVPSGRPTFCG